MKLTVLVVGAAIALSGCGALSGLSAGVSSPFSGAGGVRGSQSQVEGIRFRTRVSSVSADNRSFTTVTGGAARNVAAAAEAGRVEAVEYCIRRFGGSVIVWTASPDREPDQIPLSDGGALVLAGTCVTR